MRPDTSYVQEPQELKDLIDTTEVIQKFLPKQTDIDKILRDNKKESFGRDTLTPHEQRNTSRLFE